MESACPRTTAASRLLILRPGSGSRAFPGDRPGRSTTNVTSSSGCRAIARRQDATARLNGSLGASFGPVRNLLLGGAVLIAVRLLFPLPLWEKVARTKSVPDEEYLHHEGDTPHPPRNHWLLGNPQPQ